MIIKMGNQELAVLEDITAKEMEYILPSGINRVTSRNPQFTRIMQAYKEVVANSIRRFSQGSVEAGRLYNMDIDSPGVRGYYSIARAVADGVLVEFIR